MLTPVYNLAFAITKSDTVDFAQGPCIGIHVGTAGNVVVVFQDGTTCLFKCIAGQILPVRAKRVDSTNTTASEMVALYQV